MSRLPNDCFANASDMISVKEARDLIGKAATPTTKTETITLGDAAFRILAEDISSAIDVPPAGNSAVDGFAFSFDSYQASKSLRSIGRSAAGDPFLGAVNTGECVKIFTGAILPAGCDTIAMIEDCLIDGDIVTFPGGLKEESNHRKAGEDIKEGSLLLKSGTLLRPQELGQISSVGINTLTVFKKIRVGLFSTGDELRNPGSPLKLGQIYDSNRFMLQAILQKYGCEIQDYGILEDQLDPIKGALKKAANECDLVLTSGGVSMGDEDHVKAAVEATGSLHFWRIAIKPGRPLAMGQVGDTAFVGLPGNPVAAIVCALQFVRPLISGLSGLKNYEPPVPIFGKSQFSMSKKPGRTEWLRGRYSLNGDGQPIIEKFHTEGSGIISSLTWANGLIELGEDTQKVSPNDSLAFYPFTELYQ